MWTYVQATGHYYDPDGTLLGTGYSGAPGHVNDAASERLHDLGPCPRGEYTFGDAYNDPRLGPAVMALTPVPPFDAYGRTLLRIHGDNGRADQSASDGCLVAPPDIRDAMDASDDRLIQVV